MINPTNSKNSKADQSADNSNSNNFNSTAKQLVLYPSRSAKRLNENVLKTIDIVNSFDIQEYYGKYNEEKDNLYFILNGKYVFRCQNTKQRNLWIYAIADTNVYFKKQHNEIDESENDINFSYTQIPFYIDIEQESVKELLSQLEMKTSSVTYTTQNNQVAAFAVKFYMEHWKENVICPFYKFWVNVEGVSRSNVTVYETSKICQTIISNHIQPRKIESLLSYELSGAVYAGFDPIELIYMSSRHKLAKTPMKFNHINHEAIFEFIPKQYYGTLRGIKRNINTSEMKVENEDKDNFNLHEEKLKYQNKMDQLCPKGENCEIYKNVKNNYQYTKENYQHLVQLNHFNNSYYNKPECRYQDKCLAFQRMARINEDENNYNCYRFDDKFHLMLYRHPPRSQRGMELAKNFHKLTTQSEMENRQATDWKNIGQTGVDELVKEVVSNGFEKDLCLNSQHYAKKHYSLLMVVNEKFECCKHKKELLYPLTRAQILALLLYTGCECNYDMCKSQRNGDYKKWKYFDDCLYWAIVKLSKHESYLEYTTALYSGLHKVQLNAKQLVLSYFATYVSTSYIKDVSLRFAKNDGMIFELDEDILHRFHCCSVEWISKFQDECEILIARSLDVGSHASTLTIVDNEIVIQDTQDEKKHEETKHDQNNTHANKSRLQIVKVDRFQDKYPNIRLFSTHEIDGWTDVMNKVIFKEIPLIDTHDLDLIEWQQSCEPIEVVEAVNDSLLDKTTKKESKQSIIDKYDEMRYQVWMPTKSNICGKLYYQGINVLQCNEKFQKYARQTQKCQFTYKFTIEDFVNMQQDGIFSQLLNVSYQEFHNGLQSPKIKKLFETIAIMDKSTT